MHGRRRQRYRRTYIKTAGASVAASNGSGKNIKRSGIGIYNRRKAAASWRHQRFSICLAKIKLVASASGEKKAAEKRGA